MSALPDASNLGASAASASPAADASADDDVASIIQDGRALLAEMEIAVEDAQRTTERTITLMERATTEHQRGMAWFQAHSQDQEAADSGKLVEVMTGCIHLSGFRSRFGLLQASGIQRWSQPAAQSS